MDVSLENSSIDMSEIMRLYVGLKDMRPKTCLK
jgi:hypothetical protein